jgi:hypothetical protein
MSNSRFIVRDSPDGGYGCASELVDTSTEPPTVIGTDGGEPEDSSFRRDWGWVPGWLNRLDAENKRLVDAMTKAVEMLCADEPNMKMATADLLRAEIRKAAPR